MDKDNVREGLERAGLGKYADEIVEKLSYALRLMSTPADENTIKTGVSKIGGSPDMPTEIEWPQRDGRPLHFLAQINMGEVALKLRGDEIPNKEWLWFFYDGEQQPWGFDPADKNSSCVIYAEAPQEQLVRREAPEAIAEETYDACAIAFERIPTIPSPRTLYGTIDFSDNELDTYQEFYQKFMDVDANFPEPWHQFMGLPQEIQGRMQIQCQLASHGISCGDPSFLDHERYDELSEHADDWQLLLQLSSDEGAGMMWGDCGCLYFWIQQEALEKREFDGTWLILQCG